jgi:hypothetical protein
VPVAAAAHKQASANTAKLQTPDGCIAAVQQQNAKKKTRIVKTLKKCDNKGSDRRIL